MSPPEATDRVVHPPPDQQRHIFLTRGSHFLNASTKPSFGWCLAVFTLRQQEMTPCRWREHDRGHHRSSLPRDGKALGVLKRMRNFFLYHWCLLICPVHREHPLMFCFHVSALLHGCRKEYCKLICLPGLCWEWTPITLVSQACHRMLTFQGIYNQPG